MEFDGQFLIHPVRKICVIGRRGDVHLVGTRKIAMILVTAIATSASCSLGSTFGSEIDPSDGGQLRVARHCEGARKFRFIR
eukprot:scaffold103331_cov27-Tisochrysis_lutea.AAC.3